MEMKSFRKSHMYTLNKTERLVRNRRQAVLHHFLWPAAFPPASSISPTLVEVAEPQIEKDVWRNLS